MEGNNSYGTSWADQWDSGPDPVAYEPKKNGSGGGGMTAKYGKKVGEGLGKTKAVASTGVKKVKEGTTTGFQWIKDKKLPITFMFEEMLSFERMHQFTATKLDQDLFSNTVRYSLSTMAYWIMNILEALMNDQPELRRHNKYSEPYVEYRSAVQK
ncbi:unnamed protein product [Ilex paraguariensis]|uniref:Uncharacterized protein n=1 Tax=Ilex paraguariensis TaxID=185542 RepID=A0ABC8R1I2_9AQUA